MKSLLIIILLFSYIESSFALPAHVSDDLQVYYRSGPSTKYRLVGTLISGDAITILDDTTSKRFYKISTLQGETGWIAINKVKIGVSAKTQASKLQKSLTDSIDLIKKQADEIQRLKGLLNRQKIENENNSDKQSQLNSEISSLSNQINDLDDSNLIRWMTHAGIVTIFGVFLIFIVSIFRKRKNYNEIY
ncbi:MAG: TIGR04211 family SH3 domain-containing protein [Oceanospirillaceae bacterium]